MICKYKHKKKLINNHQTTQVWMSYKKELGDLSINNKSNSWIIKILVNDFNKILDA